MFLRKHCQHWRNQNHSHNFQLHKNHLYKRHFHTNLLYIQHLYYYWIDLYLKLEKITWKIIVTNTLTFIKISSIENKIFIVADAIINTTEWIWTVFTTWSTFAFVHSKMYNQNRDTSNYSFQSDFILHVTDYNLKLKIRYIMYLICSMITVQNRLLKGCDFRTDTIGVQSLHCNGGLISIPNPERTNFFLASWVIWGHFSN